MRVFVDTPFGATLSFNLSCRNKVSDIKRRIEYSRGIPVSMQTLHFNGVELLVDHHQLSTCRIVNNSRLLLLLRDAHVPSMARSIYGQVPPSHASASFSNQVLHQTPQVSPVPSSHASASFSNQDLSSNVDQDASEAFFNQYGQTYESVLETFSMDEFLERDTEPWTAQDIRKMEGIWPGTTGDNVNVQESLGRNSKNQDLLQETARTSENQVQKLTLVITQYDKRGSQFLVEVNESDNVEELRKELEKIEDKTQLDLPAKGYVFMHKRNVLVDCKSFYWNRVAHGDTIEIFPGAVTKGYNT